MFDQQHVWMCKEDFSEITLHSRVDLEPHMGRLARYGYSIQDHQWPAVEGVNCFYIKKYEIEVGVALFYRNKNDVKNIVSKINKLLELGEVNFIGLEKVPSILDGMTVNAATEDKCELPKLPDFAKNT